MKTIRDKFSSKGLCGLVNNSNLCYMNSAIQCLSNTLPLTIYFLSKPKFSKVNGLICNWYILLYNLWLKNGIISPISFINSISNIDERFDGKEQEDITEFIIFFLNALHERLSFSVECKEKKKEIMNLQDTILYESKHKFLSDLMNKKSIISEIFGGQYISILETEHKEFSYTFDVFFTIDLEIPDKDCRLEDCFKMMCREDLLINDNKWYSEKSKSYVNSKKKMVILKCPNILIINLKRFSGIHKKKNNKVIFPFDNLNLNQYCYFNIDTKYKLYAIANHYGFNNFGHYSCYCLNLNKKWYYYNDESVKEIDIKNISFSNAYCLFYYKC